MATASKVSHPFKVGDIFVNSWGYDQTNIDYYEVVAATAKSVRIAKIAAGRVPGSEGFMSCQVMPMPGEFVLDHDGNRIEYTKFPYTFDWRGEAEWAVKFSYGSGRPHNPGQSAYCSWYA